MFTYDRRLDVLVVQLVNCPLSPIPGFYHSLLALSVLNPLYYSRFRISHPTFSITHILSSSFLPFPPLSSSFLLSPPLSSSLLDYPTSIPSNLTNQAQRLRSTLMDNWYNNTIVCLCFRRRYL